MKTLHLNWISRYFAIGFWLVFGALATTVCAQSALDGFDPNANNVVRVVVVQPDGKILIGGDFTTVGGVTRNRIARLNPDGTLDTAFNPNANGSIVYAIAVQPDGKILVGGNFNGANSIGGQTRNYIARLDATTGAADSFDPNANNSVYSIAIQSDGKILVGGQFNGASSIGGQTRNYIARLDQTTGAADSWNPSASGSVFAIAVQSDGKILVGGGFNGANSIGGQTRNSIARLDATTGAADSFNPNANGAVNSIAIQSDGKILVGGFFNGANSIGGQTRNYIARLNADGTLDTAFNPNANATVQSIAVQSDGKILAGGNFFGANSISGQTRNYIARLDAATGAADSFNPNANNPVISIAVQSDGKVLAGGQFLGANSIGGQTRNRIARLERDGLLDQTLNNLSTVGTFVAATAIQPDGKIIIGGVFTSVLGTARNNIARLNTDGTLDTAFNPNASNAVYAIAIQSDGKILVGGIFTGANSIGGATRNNIARLDATTGAADSFDPNANIFVNAIAVQSDGKILVGGAFTTIGGQTRSRIARLDATTGLADSWNPSAVGVVNSIAVQSDGKILAGGAFTTIGGQPRNRIARLDATTGLADSFNPNANSDVYAITVQSDGKVLVGGIFNGAAGIGGQSRNRIARLDSATGLADSFNPNATADVYSIAVQSDGKILAGGAFTGANSIGGQTRNNIARLDATTGAADSFNPTANANILSIAIQSDGKILAGGNFTTIGGQSRSLFARLSNDTAALSTLSVTKTTVTLTRNGSAAQFTRVIFEQSTDNGATYTLLGTATNSFATPAPNNKDFTPLAPTAAGYTLTGLNLPQNQNILIRARGYYRSGYQSGSETTEDKAQSAFLPITTAAAVSISGRVITDSGNGLRNARVYLTDQNGETQTATTSSFGYYRFEEVAVGQTVVVTIVSKRYQFAPQVMSITGELTDLNFTALP